MVDNFAAAQISGGQRDAVILQPARLGVHESDSIKITLRRAIDEQTVRQDLVWRAPQRPVIDGNLHGKARRHGGGVVGYNRVGFANFAFSGVETKGKSRERVASLGNVLHQGARFKWFARRQRSGNWTFWRRQCRNLLNDRVRDRCRDRSNEEGLTGG